MADGTAHARQRLHSQRTCGERRQGLSRVVYFEGFTVIVVCVRCLSLIHAAALKVLSQLTMPWPLLYFTCYFLVPPFIRDFFYRIVASNRSPSAATGIPLLILVVTPTLPLQIPVVRQAGCMQTTDRPTAGSLSRC